jgi:hypothetical protein
MPVHPVLLPEQLYSKHSRDPLGQSRRHSWWVGMIDKVQCEHAQEEVTNAVFI